MNSEEHMMKLLPENFSIIDCHSSQTGSDVSAPDLIADIHSECLNLDGTLTLRFHSDHAVINFSVFPSTTTSMALKWKNPAAVRDMGQSF